jgi:hypothetical protein
VREQAPGITPPVVLRIDENARLDGPVVRRAAVEGPEAEPGPDGALVFQDPQGAAGGIERMEPGLALGHGHGLGVGRGLAAGMAAL